ncbi:TerD family protein [Streptomyces sp. NBC_00690]|uniref:TerD family protein n=1 Tax=Streptomyces sp. NBC_00690 TaxID=2975808 RepID=UPI002E2A139D|nr:TerD family protein [Streptomyces sp. NBC_00690]
MSVRVSTRGVRVSVGSRTAQVGMVGEGGRAAPGAGSTRVAPPPRPVARPTSSPGRGTSTRRTAPHRSVAPSAEELDLARQRAVRSEHDAQRDAAIIELQQLWQRMTHVHLQTFPPARPPVVAGPPMLGVEWARAEAQAFHLRGLGVFARSERAVAKDAAEQDAPVYLTDQQARLRGAHEQLLADAEQWWRALTGNDEEIVCEAVNAAFADNPAAGCAVGVDGSVMSVVMRQQDIDALPTQAPGATPAGRPTLRDLGKRELTERWLTVMGSHVIATLKEGFATAPGITAINLAVLTRMPETRRLGVVAYGRWTRRAIESTAWQGPDDALRFLEIGEDVLCSVKKTAAGNTSSTVKPLNTRRMPGLQDLLDHARDEPDSAGSTLANLNIGLHDGGPDVDPEFPSDPYWIMPFAQWRETIVASPTAATMVMEREPVVSLVPGQTLTLPEEAWRGLLVAFSFAGADADLTLFLTDGDGQVAGDEDFVFYNQPSAAAGAVRLLGRHTEGPDIVESASIQLAALPARVRRVAVAVNMNVESGLACGALTHASLRMECGSGAAWAFHPPSDPDIRAMVVAELYRHTLDGSPVWKLRAIGQGWADGLDALARAHGVDVQ